jgi:hypothetical protein
MDTRAHADGAGRRCGIAGRLARDVPCPPGGSALLTALGFDDPGPAGEHCPVDAIAEDARAAPIIVQTLDELRRELDRSGLALPAARGARTRAGRHERTLERWPVRQ